MSELVPRTVLANFTRAKVLMYDNWDGPHQFMSLHWEDGHLETGTLAFITPDVPAEQYPDMMRRVAADAEHNSPPVAYLLRFEGWLDSIAVDASPEQRRAFENDPRPIRDRPSRVEVCMALCADVHGRLWHAQKRRDTGGITEMFVRPGSDVQAGGRFAQALLAVAYAAGMAYHDLPGPPWVAN